MGRTTLGRADLLRALVAGCDAGRLADLLGFDPVSDPGAVLDRSAAGDRETASASPSALTRDMPDRPTAERPPLQMPQYVEIDRVTVLRRDPVSPAPPLPPSSWLPAQPPGRPRRPAAVDELTPPARLMPRLCTALGAYKPAGVDVRAAVARAASARPWHMLARTTRVAWPGSLLVLMDLSDRLRPYWLDMHDLAARLVRTIGLQACQVRVLLHADPSAGGTDWLRLQTSGKSRKVAARCQPIRPEPGQTVLLLSDLGRGCGIEDDVIAGRWARWMRAQAATVAWQVVSPNPLSCPANRTGRLPLPVWSWSDHGLRAQRHFPVRQETEGAAPADPTALRDLLALCAPAVRIEPALLRRLRRLLGPAGQDAGLEVRVWWHPDMLRDGLCCHWGPHGSQTAHAARFGRMPARMRREVLQVLMDGHAALSPFVKHEEALRWQAATPPGTADADDPPAAVGAAQAHFRAFIEHLAVTPPGAEPGVRAYAQRLLGRAESLPPSAEALDLEQLAHWVAQRNGVARDAGRPLHVVQSGGCVRLRSGPPGRGEQVLLTLPGAEVVRWSRADQPGERVVVIAGRPVDMALLMLEREGWPALAFRAGAVHADLRALCRPTWADEWGRDRSGRAFAPVTGPHGRRLSLSAPWGGEVTAPLASPSDRMKLGVGADPIGCFALMAVDGVEQRLRYIEPGTFLMGSPGFESDRQSDEGPQHQVTLTEGFWLADTTCTQALWQAVMGRNPSHFKDSPDLPVDSVSWDDVQGFLQRLQKLLPAGCDAVLPTEAQWEYACRAGTQTPYWFGDTLSADQAHVGQSLGNGKTVPVKARPANGWGLYQMHGNVWEWCEGSRRKYGAKSEEDPPDGQDSGVRPLRGGSWLNPAGWARSACRLGNLRASRSGFYGFRFALRSIKPGLARARGGAAGLGDSHPAEPGAGTKIKQ